MSKRPITLAQPPRVVSNRGQAVALLARSEARVSGVMLAAAPPEAMASAPAAPARGPMQLVPNYEVTPGGMRRQAGSHWRAVCALEAMNAQAVQRAERRGVVAMLPFSAGQVSIAAIYRGLVEWRQGGAVRCSGFEAGRGGAGSGVFIDTFIAEGARVDALCRAIGDGFAFRPRRSMDRGNARKPLSDRALVDAVVIDARDLSAVLRRFGWEANGQARKALRLSLCAALDRMQGYHDGGSQNMD